MRRLRFLRLLAVLALATAVASPPPSRAAVPRTWYLTNIFEEHRDGNTLWLGPGLVMSETPRNGTSPSGYLLIANVGGYASRTWSASPEVGDVDLGRRPFTVTFGGASVVTGVRFTVGSWDWRTAVFLAAPGEPATVGPLGTATFTPSADFVIPKDRVLGMRVWHPGGETPPSLLDVYDEANGPSPSRLRLD